MSKNKSLPVTLTALFYIILFTTFTLASLLYGWSAFFGNQSSLASFWLKAGIFLFKFIFPDWSWFFIVALAISLAGVYASLALMKRKAWSRILFLAGSALLSIWIIVRTVVIFQNAPGFVKFTNIFSNNPVTRYPSLLYFGSSILLCIVAVIAIVSFFVLISHKASEEF